MKRWTPLMGTLAMLLAVMVLIRYWSTHKVQARTAKFNNEVENLFTGLQTFKENIGTYPSGGNAEVAKALRGKNPKNVIILVGREHRLSDKGEFVDPWGTPLRIYFSDSGVMVRSAGPNRRFEDSTASECDDYFRSN